MDDIRSYSSRNVYSLNTLRPRQNGRHYPDIFKWIFFNENVWISINISLKFVPRGPISNIPTLVQVMAWRRPGDKPLSEPMMFRLPTHICVTRPQWVNSVRPHDTYMHQETRPSLVQKMTCHLLGTKALSGPMLACFQLEPLEQTSVKFSAKFKHFHSRKCVSKCCPQNGSHCVSASMC